MRASTTDVGPWPGWGVALLVHGVGDELASGLGHLDARAPVREARRVNDTKRGARGIGRERRDSHLVLAGGVGDGIAVARHVAGAELVLGRDGGRVGNGELGEVADILF